MTSISRDSESERNDQCHADVFVSDLLHKTLDYSVFQTAIFQGVSLEKYCDRKNKVVTIPVTERLLSKVGSR